MALQDVQPFTGSNSPGACKLLVIPVTNVVSVPPETQSRIDTEIPLIGASWVSITGTRWTHEFEEVWDRSSGTVVAKASVAMEVPKDELLKLEQFWSMGRGRFLVLNFDRNGTVKLMGTKDEPAMVTIQRLGHGARYGDPNAYELRVTCTRGTKCPFYLPPIPEVPPPPWCPSLYTMLSVQTGGYVWGLLSDVQRDNLLLVAGVTTLTEVNDEEPYGSYQISDE
jgi:hypothetical protein